MSIPVACGCGKSYKVAEVMAGRRGRCPYCKAEVAVPAASRAIVVRPEVPMLVEVREDEPRTPVAVPGRGDFTAAIVLVPMGIVAFAVIFGAISDGVVNFRTIVVGVMASFASLPLTVPIALARLGVLSSSRWASLSGVALSISVLGICAGVATVKYCVPNPAGSSNPFVELFEFVILSVATLGFIGIFGTLFAASLYRESGR